MLKLLFFAFLLSASFAESATPVKSVKEQLWAIESSIDRVVLSVDPHVHIGIEIVSLKTGQRIYAKNAYQLFIPASNMKLLTGAAALYLLGNDYRFETKIYSDGPIENGVVKGNLYIQGSGDPELTTRALEELVFQLKMKEIHGVEGHLYVDNEAFDGVAQGPGWTWDDGAVVWNSPMDALTLNHSCVNVWVKPNSCCDKPPVVYVNPKTEFVTIENLALTTLKKNDLSVDRRWITRENVIQVKGCIASNQEIQKFVIPVESPHLYTAHVLRDLLVKNGTRFNGEIEKLAVAEGAVELASYSSRPLSAVVEQMMKDSDNLIADCIFKKLGQLKVSAPGTWQGGTKALKEFLSKQVGLDVSNMVVLDGSGMSRYNLVSPHQFVQFLVWMDQQFSISPEWQSTLPVSGVDGTLQHRMQDPAVKGKVRAKSGSLKGVSTLSGYVVTKDGEKLAFSIMMSGFTKESSEYKFGIEDQIMKILASYSKN